MICPVLSINLSVHQGMKFCQITGLCWRCSLRSSGAKGEKLQWECSPHGDGMVRLQWNHSFCLLEGHHNMPNIHSYKLIIVFLHSYTVLCNIINKIEYTCEDSMPRNKWKRLKYVYQSCMHKHGSINLRWWFRHFRNVHLYMRQWLSVKAKRCNFLTRSIVFPYHTKATWYLSAHEMFYIFFNAL